MSEEAAKFDVVIMNPPYQEEDGGHSKSAMNIYDDFIKNVVQVMQPDHLISINPSRWFAGGKGLDDFREWMLQGGPVNPSDKKQHIKKIVDFPKSSDVFGQSVNISGGVNYWHWKKNHNQDAIFKDGDKEYPISFSGVDVLIKDPISRSILDKVSSKNGPFKIKDNKGKLIPSPNYVGTAALVRKPYGLSTNFLESHKKGVDWSETEKPGWHPCFTKDGDRWVNPKWVNSNVGTIGGWKVMCSRADGAAYNAGRVLGPMWVAEPGWICLETYLVVALFNSERAAKDFLKYSGTKFFRFVLGLRKVSQDNSKDRFSWVPCVPPTVAKTEDDLSDYFGLDKTEKNHILSTVKG